MSEKDLQNPPSQLFPTACPERVVGAQSSAAQEGRVIMETHTNRKTASNSAVVCHFWALSSRGKWSGADLPWHWSSPEVLGLLLGGVGFPGGQWVRSQTGCDSMSL